MNFTPLHRPTWTEVKNRFGQSYGVQGMIVKVLTVRA